MNRARRSALPSAPGLWMWRPKTTVIWSRARRFAIVVALGRMLSPAKCWQRVGEKRQERSIARRRRRMTPMTLQIHQRSFVSTLKENQTLRKLRTKTRRRSRTEMHVRNKKADKTEDKNERPERKGHKQSVSARFHVLPTTSVPCKALI